MPKSICIIESCEEKTRALSYCNKHYLKFKRHGDPLYASGRVNGAECSISGCAKTSIHKGWCFTHYHAWRRGGDPEWIAPKAPPSESRQCEVDGCDRDQISRSLCATHYSRLRRTGTAAANGGIADCSVEGCMRPHRATSYCAMHLQRVRKYGEPGPAQSMRWGSNRKAPKNGYVMLTANGRRIAEHRFVMEEIIGRRLLPDENVHHINGVKSDNRPENLELWTTAQPAGQRVEDQVQWALEILRRYGNANQSQLPAMR